MAVQSLRTLLIDTNAEQARRVERALAESSEPITVAHVSDVPLAIAHLGRGEVDVILVDLAGTTEAVRRPQSAAPHVPIVALTDDEAPAMRAGHEGAQGSLPRRELHPPPFARTLRYGGRRKT